jgi:adenine/guanine phosphoribosyltransferase-like PRPP-binding protein
MPSITTNDPEALLLGALAETLSDERRAIRFLDMTGIDAPSLRERAADRSTLEALLDFLEAYEPDLIAVAAALGVKPEALVAARAGLGA